MAKTTRNLAMAVAAATIAVPHTSMVADAPVSTVPPMSHVRTTDPEVAAVVRNTFDRSATFRKLVAIIDASDSYVYVQAGQCSHSVRACFVSVTASDTHRFMRRAVLTRPVLPLPPARLCAPRCGRRIADPCASVARRSLLLSRSRQ